jgi:hypothetical protein
MTFRSSGLTMKGIVSISLPSLTKGTRTWTIRRRECIAIERETNSKMKRTILLFFAFLLLSGGSMKAQTRVLKCYSYASKHKDYYGNWTEWSQTKATDFEIVMNFDAGHFSFYSEKTHTYNVLKNEGHEVDEDGDDVYWFYCLDNEGIRCRVRLYKLNKQSGRNQVYITFNDLSIVYNVETVR